MAQTLIHATRSHGIESSLEVKGVEHAGRPSRWRQAIRNTDVPLCARNVHLINCDNEVVINLLADHRVGLV